MAKKHAPSIELPSVTEIEASTDTQQVGAESMNFVAANSKVFVPKVYDHFVDPEKKKRYIIMAHIPGTNLQRLSTSLTSVEKKVISKRIREALDEIRNIPSQGYLGNLNRTPYFEGIFYSPEHDPAISGPFESEGQLNEGLLKCLSQRESPHYVRLLRGPIIERTLKGHRTVFTHVDLQRKSAIVFGTTAVRIQDHLD
ncbi:hypothetical protein BDV12DRAFT_202610 [Aspergillus spectabilis]